MSPRRGNLYQHRKPRAKSLPSSEGQAGSKLPGKRPARERAKRIGELFEALVALQARLRAPNGCPWDREQTHDSLRTYLVEETYEVLEALDSGDDAKIAAELGDLLLQIVFHSQLAREAGRFDIAEVIERIHTKLVRRHPHVFGRVRAKTSAQVLKNWEQLKSDERQAEQERSKEHGATPGKKPYASLLDGVPRTLPAVLEAYQLTRRASRIGFDWDNIQGLFEKLAEEIAELRAALGPRGASRLRDTSRTPDARLEEEIGDLLFVAVNVARFLDADPEIALKKANRKFIARFKEMEHQAARSGRRLADVSRDELERLWEQAKAQRLPSHESGA